MKIILSPAKKMKILDEVCSFGQPFYDLTVTEPVYLEKTKEILAWLKEQSFAELQKLWNCSDKIAEQNVNRLAEMDLYRNLTPAVFSYEGLAYQYMAPAVFEDGHFEYVQEHLRILSAFYGVLRAMDGVTPYRLEMQAKAAIGRGGGSAGRSADGIVSGNIGACASGTAVGNVGAVIGSGGENPGRGGSVNIGRDDSRSGNLYDYWGDALYRAVRDESGVIINLASREYSKCIEKYLTPEDRYITVNFCEQAGGAQNGKAGEKDGGKDGDKTGGNSGTGTGRKLVTKATYAKMARGEMVRFMAEHQIEDPVEIKKFDRFGYVFREDLSTETEYVFERIPEKEGEKA